GRLRQLRRRVDRYLASIGEEHPVLDRRRRRQQVEAVLALEPFLHDVHVQQPEEARAEPGPQRCRLLRLVLQRRVVELKLLEGVAQLLVVLSVRRVQPREHHWLRRLIARKRRRGGARVVRYRVADAAFSDRLQPGRYVADLARRELVRRRERRPEDADLERLDD